MTANLAISTATSPTAAKPKGGIQASVELSENASGSEFAFAFTQLGRRSEEDVKLMGTLEESTRRDRIDGEISKQSTDRNQQGSRADGIRELDRQSDSRQQPAHDEPELREQKQASSAVLRDRQIAPSDTHRSSIETHESREGSLSDAERARVLGSSRFETAQSSSTPDSSSESSEQSKNSSTPAAPQFRHALTPAIQPASLQRATANADQSSAAKPAPKIQSTLPVVGEKAATETTTQKNQLRQSKTDHPSRSTGHNTGDTTRDISREGFAKLLRTIRLNLRPGKSSAVLHLEPPDLGRVRIHMAMQAERVSLRVDTESIDARTALTSRISDLAASLKESGLDLTDYEFSQPSTDEWNHQPSGDADDQTPTQLEGLNNQESEESQWDPEPGHPESEMPGRLTTMGVTAGRIDLQA